MLCLGADAVQMGTRFLLTPEASLHDAYKAKVLAAGVGDTTPWAGVACRFARCATPSPTSTRLRKGAGQPREALEALFGSRSLKMAAMDGDVDQGKVEAGQSAALIDGLEPAAVLVERIAAETREAMARIANQWK